MRPLAAVLLLGLGAGTGLASVAVHEIWWGMLLIVPATAAALLGLPPGWWSRLPFALGWTGLVASVVTPRPEGDYAIGQGPAGYALLGLALVVLVFGLATLPRPGGRDRRVRA